jgi:hypothetical protein
MTDSIFEIELLERSHPPALRPLTVSELEQLNQPLAVLEEPAPHTKLGQQVRRLEQHGLSKAARAVKTCGRLGEKSTYQCRRIVRKIIRAHLRFCCAYCDRRLATRLFDEHRDYSKRLHPGATLYRLTIRFSISELSGTRIRNFEDSVVEAVRHWMKDYHDWGFKSLTHYDKGDLTVEGIIALPASRSLPAGSLSVPNATCHVEAGNSASAFEAMLSDIVRPRLTDGHGVLRADLMAAFQGGNHFRSLAIFYGLVSKKRRERKDENLHLSNTRSGAGSEVPLTLSRPSSHCCPAHGPQCRRTAFSIEILSVLDQASRDRYTTEPAIGETLRELWSRKYGFWLHRGPRSSENR